MRILLVEDDSLLGDGIRAGLKLADYAVDWVRDGEAARLALLDHAYQACVLDLGLPKRDGLSVLKDLRARGNHLPVLILTARDSSADKIAGLDAGADDYLTKPFAFTELTARIQVLLRRTLPAQEAGAVTVVRLEALELDLLKRKSQRAGQRLDLTAKEFSLLELLMRRQGEVLSRTELAAQVWDMNYDSETNVVEVAIRRLRNKLDTPFGRVLLHTVRGMGYVLEERDA